jgi:VIT1/CCC1 family predicted Fe2+/Mn2+ transporter
VFGASDGLVSNVLLIIGLAGASASADVVMAAGSAGLLAGAISMASGAYVSVRAHNEVVRSELARERAALEEDPEEEAEELAELYVERGVEPEQARSIADILMRDPEIALEVHAREELGVDPSALASPLGAAGWSFVAFAIGAFVPVVPWFLAEGSGATWASVVLGVLGAASIGTALAVTTGRPVASNVTRHVLIAVGAAGVTWLIGNALGAAVSL